MLTLRQLPNNQTTSGSMSLNKNVVHSFYPVVAFKIRFISNQSTESGRTFRWPCVLFALSRILSAHQEQFGREPGPNVFTTRYQTKNIVIPTLLMPHRPRLSHFTIEKIKPESVGLFSRFSNFFFSFIFF